MRNYSKLDNPKFVSALFHPLRSKPPVNSANVHNIDIAVDNETNIGCTFYCASPESYTLLYFHGNGETVSDYAEIAQAYNEFDINVFLATYRGYGWSSGAPDVTSMISDSTIILEKFLQTLDSMNISGPVFVMGRSLGSVSAIELVNSEPDRFKGLIIESGFADTIPLLNQLGVATDGEGLSEADGFGNLEKIEEIKIPTLILHGAKDAIIPVAQAEKLQSFSGAKAKKFFIIPGADHNSMISTGGRHYFSTIKSFMDEQSGNNSWRERRRKHKTGEK